MTIDYLFYGAGAIVLVLFGCIMIYPLIALYEGTEACAQQGMQMAAFQGGHVICEPLSAGSVVVPR